MTDAPGPQPGAETRRVSIVSSKLVVVSGVLALIGLALTLAHFIWPTPLMLTLFMIFGQGAYGAGVLVYLLVIFVDLRRKKVL